MLYIPLVLVIYLVLLFPCHLFPFPFFLALLLILFFLAEDEKKMVRIIIFAAVLASAVKASNTFCISLGLEKERISGITGIASSEPSIKNDGMQYFSVELSSVRTDHGIYASASGMVGVLSPYNPFGRDAFIRAEGYFAEDGFFFAEHVEAESLSVFDTARRSIRFFLSSRLKGLNGEELELFRLLFFGAGYDPENIVVEKGREKGVSHVFALSGMHLSILSSFLVLPLAPFIGRKRARALSIPLLFSFTWLSSFRASLFRAFCFRMIFFLFPDADSDEAVCLSFILLSLFFPENLFCAASVYSFLSLSGMFFFSPIENAPLIRFFKPVVQSAGALSFSIPYSLMLFGSFTLSGLFFSFPITFLVTVFMALCMIALIFPFLSFLIRYPYEVLSFILSRIPSSASTNDVGTYAGLLLILSYLLLAVHVAKPAKNHLS